MEIQKAFSTIQNYFTSKIENGEYDILRETISVGGATATIKIDSYTFKFWCNNGANHFKFYSSDEDTRNVFNQLFTTDSMDKEKAYKMIKSKLDAHYQEVTLKAKREQFEKLKQELGEIDN